MKKPKIFIACDTTNLTKIKKQITAINTFVIPLKYRYAKVIKQS